MRHEPERLTKEELEEAETVFQELEKDIPALEDAPLSPKNCPRPRSPLTN